MSLFSGLPNILDDDGVDDVLPKLRGVLLEPKRGFGAVLVGCGDAPKVNPVLGVVVPKPPKGLADGEVVGFEESPSENGEEVLALGAEGNAEEPNGEFEGLESLVGAKGFGAFDELLVEDLKSNGLALASPVEGAED